MFRSRTLFAFALLFGVLFLTIWLGHLTFTEKVQAGSAAQLPAPAFIWASTGGPLEAQVTSLFYAQGNFWAATNSNVWASADFGRNWQKRNTGLGEQIAPFSFASIDTTLFVGTRNGVFRSNNGGQLWQSANVGMPATEILLTLQSDGEKLYALSFSYGLFRSTDKGESWTPLKQGLPAGDLTLLARGNTIWVATSRGIYRSTDGGQSWARTNQGIPVNATANSFATDGERVYVSLAGSGITQGAAPRGVFVWNEKENIWASLNDGLGGAAVQQLHVLGAELYAATDKGVYRREKEWVLPANSGLRGTPTAFASVDKNLLVASGGDLFISENRGDKWTPLNVTFDIASFFTAFAYNNAGTYASTLNGVYRRSNPLPAKWQRVSNGLDNPAVVDLTTQDQTLWAASRNGATYFSEDNGANWTSRNAGLDGLTLSTIAATESNVLVGTKGKGVFSLVRRGPLEAWQATNEGLTGRSVNDLLTDGATVYAATNQGVFRSTNGGALWTAINKGLLLEIDKQPYEPKSLAIDGNTLYAVIGLQAPETADSISSVTTALTDYRVFRSDDGGVQWTSVMLPGNTPARFAQIVASPQGLLALGSGTVGFVLNAQSKSQQPAQEAAVVWLSTDKGKTWIPADAGLQTYRFPVFSAGAGVQYGSLGSGLLLGATPTQGLFANAYGQGVYARDLVNMGCRYEVRASATEVSSAASTVTVQVTPSANSCGWRAESQSDWITIPNAPGGLGAGSVRLDIAANPSGEFRYGTVTIAGASVSLTQGGCTVSANPDFQRVEAGGGTATLRITAADTCQWEIKTNAQWLTTTAALKGKGNATINFTIAPNANNQGRTAAISLNNKTYSIAQSSAASQCAAQPITLGQWTRGSLTASDCPFVTTFPAESRASVADYYSFTAQAGQQWTVYGFDADGRDIFRAFSSPAIAVIKPDGSLLYLQPEFIDPVQQPNLARHYRFRTDSAGSYTLIVTQFQEVGPANYLIRLVASDCGLNLGKNATALPANEASETFAIRADAGCGWQAIGTVPWIRLSDSEGRGDGSFSLSAAENPGVERSGFVLINNRHLFVRQAAGASAARTFTGLDPSYAETGATGLLINVRGNGFTNDSRVLWDNQPLPTTYVSASQLRAAVPASELTLPREVLISIETASSNAWRTPSLPFVVRPAQQLWAPVNGPGGGFITAIAQQGTKHWVGTNNGRIFSSTDGGRRWQREANFSFGNVNQLLISGNLLYVSLEGVIYRRDLKLTNASWNAIPFPDNSLGFISQGLASKGDAVYTIANNQLYRIQPDTRGWTLVNKQLATIDNVGVIGLGSAGDAVNDPLYVLMTEYQPSGLVSKLLISTDEGKNFRAISLAPPTSSQAGTLIFNRFFIISRRPYFATSNGIFRLDDREQLIRVGNADNGTGQAPGNVNALALDGDTLYASTYDGIYSTPDAAQETDSPRVFRLEGDRWSAADESLDAGSVNTLAATSSGLLVGTNRGLWQSGNRGVTWNERNQGLNALTVNLLATSGNTLYAATANGIYRTADFGQSWSRADYGLPLDFNYGVINTGVGGINNLYSIGIRALATDGDSLYAALPSGVYRSTDQGQNWRNTGLIGYTVNALGFAGKQVLAGATRGIVTPLSANNNSLLPFTLTEPGVYRSTDGTGSWRINESSLFSDLPTSFAVLGNKVFVGTTASGVRVSEDNGLTWRASNNGVAANAISSLATVGTTLLATTTDALYRSTDQGQTWQLAPNAPRYLYQLRTNLNAGSDANAVYGFDGTTVYCSNDLGESWRHVPRAEGYQLTAIQPLGQRLFAGTTSDGVLMANLAPERATAVNAASYTGGELAPNSIATIFGTNLGMGTQLASGDDLPEELAGTRVTVRSSTGNEYPAKLFFVSPGQINFLMPQLPVNAVPAQIFTTTATGQQTIADIRVAETAFGLFAANGNGQGVPNAVALRVKADGTQSYEPVFRFDSAQNRFVPQPLDVSEENGRLFLVLYGTGIDRRVSTDKVTVLIGEQPGRVAYAGPQGSFAGVDQLNVVLSPALAGKGEVDLRVTVNGKAANTLRVAFK